MLSKLSKRDEAFTVYTYDNGYMVEIPGRDSHDEWTTVKLVCSSIEEVVQLIDELDKIEVNR